MVVDEYVFPVLLGSLVDLMHDAEMWMCFGELVPKIPRPTMQGAMSILVQVFHRAEVADDHSLVICDALVCGQPRSLAQD